MVNIVINSREGRQVVSARELYDFLGFDKSQWARWYQKNIELNDFASVNEDYEVLDIMSKTSGGRPSVDFALSIDFAKRLSMMARTERGEQARQYFLECERKLKEQQQVSLPSAKQLAMMVIEAEEAKEKVQQELSEANKQLQISAPKVLFANAILGSKTSCLVQELAKIITQNGYPIGQNRLFE